MRSPREVETDSELTVAEVTRRAAAVVALTILAAVLAVQLPALFAEDVSLGVVSMGAMALGLWLAWMLAAAPPCAPHLWRLVAAAGGVALAGWAGTRLFAVPGVAGARGGWLSAEAAAAAVAAAASVVLAALAVPLTRRGVRAAATAIVVLAAVGPSVAMTLVALGPRSAPAASAGAHQHASSNTDAAIRLRPGFGRDGGHYVIRVPTPPHLTAPGVALLSAAAALFAFGAVASLAQRRRRPASAPVG